MVVCQILLIETLSAVLTFETIPRVDVFPGELYFPFVQADVAYETNDRWDAHGSGDGMNLETGLFYHLNLAEKKKLYRSLPIDDVERFE